ncbi:hypothetical protein [Dyella sp.]|uniref:hypothetical protein n=1 Tax=Dyella sp. TaxID=1869338 RepID=UPI002B4801E1|nr:hypothetical protein [Dyella sp.]
MISKGWTHGLRRMATLFVAFGFLFSMERACYDAYRGMTSIAVAVALSVAFLALAIGLFRMNWYARRITAGMCLLAATLLPLACVIPFHMTNLELAPASTSGLELWMVPFLVICLGLAWLIDPPRRKVPLKPKR